jgi:hypothetical protein
LTQPRTERGPWARIAAGRIEGVKIDLPDDYVPLVVNALEHYYALTKARQQDDVRYQEIADWFKRKRPGGGRTGGGEANGGTAAILAN